MLHLLYALVAAAKSSLKPQRELNPDNGKLKWARQYRIGPVASPQDNIGLMEPTFWPLAGGGLAIGGQVQGDNRDRQPAAFQIKPNGQPAK